MQSTKLKGPMLLFPMLLALQGCTLFASGRPIVASTPSACSSLVPDEWFEGVESADLGNDGAAISDWMKFADAQTGQLDKSNDHFVSAMGIIKRCEERDAAAIKAATKRGIF